jgi:hypothetical protein
VRIAVILLLAFPTFVLADFKIASRGKAQCVIVVQERATAAEKQAAEELAEHLSKMTGGTFGGPEVSTGEKRIILIGQGSIASNLFPEVPFSSLGGEETIAKTKGDVLLLAGGRPRGTLYAVYRFLHKQGVRWWTPWATTIPKRPTLTVQDIDIREKPAFEYREAYWWLATNPDWAARNYNNGHFPAFTANHGGKVGYNGFVHTFYGLVPPDKYFATHPEWFSEVNGQRTWQNAQLCTTNPQLRDFMVEQVKKQLRANPDAKIISVSQNDCFNPCTCVNCKALDDREGSHAGSMIALVNYIGEKIEREFPDVAVDTLAYQYTRKAPKTIKPRHNVIVRLCSIECSFAQPLEAPRNASFGDDLRAWGKLSNRLYVWDYVTDFAHYMLPFPNWNAIGPNIRFFHANGTRGVFEEGAYESAGASMSELEAWVQSQLLWDPKQDDKALIKEFLRGYYGEKPALAIETYMQLMASKVTDHYMTCYNGPGAPYFDFATMAQADRLWQEAARMAPTAEHRWRIHQSHLAVRYVFLVEWPRLRREAIKAGARWPMPLQRSVVAREWLTLATSPGPEGWKPIKTVREGSLTPQAFIGLHGTEVSDPVVPVLPKRTYRPPLPLDIGNSEGGIDVQDDQARLARDGVWSEMRGDPSASDGIAIWMPGNHYEWATQFPLSRVLKPGEKRQFRVYVVLRVDKDASAAGRAFTAGLYDDLAGRGLNTIHVDVPGVRDSYASYSLGIVEAHANMYVWIAPPANAGVRAVYVDRVVLVPVK